jgi:hypothetical protein
MKNLKRIVFTGALAAGLLLCAGPASALAVEQLGLSGTFGGATSFTPNPDPLSSPAGIAVNEVASGDVGDVYVVDRPNNRIEQFSPSGAFLSAWGWGVSDGRAQYEVCTSRCQEGLAGSGAGQLDSPEAIAVDNCTNSLTKEPCTTLEDPSAGDVYVTNTADDAIDKFSAGGAYLGQLAEPTFAGFKEVVRVYPGGGIGVDESGLVWVYYALYQRGGGDPQPVIGVFNDALENLFISSPEEAAGGIARSGFAVDSEDNFYLVTQENPETVSKVNTTTHQVKDVSEGYKTGLAVDLSNNDLYIDNGVVSGREHKPIQGGTTVSELAADGSPLETFGAGPLQDGGAVAVDSATHSVYVAEDAGDDVDVFTLGAPPAPPSTEPATEVGHSSATLHAQLNPEEAPGGFGVGFYFSYDEGASCTGPGSVTTTFDNGAANATGSGELPEQAAVGDLEPGTTYAFCLVADKHGLTPGPALTFTTLSFAPAVEVGSEQVHAGSITPSGAIFEANVNPEKESTTCEFQYVEAAKYEPTALNPYKAGTSAPCETSLAGRGFQHVAATATDLQSGTTYHFRVVASNATSVGEGKPTAGEDSLFTTQGTALLSAGQAQSITRTTATFSGTVDPVGAETTYHFAYIDQAGYERALAGDSEEKADPYADGEATAPIELTELVEKNKIEKILVPDEGYAAQAVGPILATAMLPGTIYHYALVAENLVGVTIGPDETLTTLSRTPPLVTTGPPSAVSQNSATLSGTVTTNGLQTEYGFEIGTEPNNYGPATGLGSVGGALTEAVTLTLIELQPGTTYYYRVTATNADGTETGQPATFTTPGFPTLLTTSTALPLIATPQIAFPAGSQANTGGAETTTKKLTRAEKLSKALKLCHTKNAKQRASCEKAADKKYGKSKKGKK